MNELPLRERLKKDIAIGEDLNKRGLKKKKKKERNANQTDTAPLRKIQTCGMKHLNESYSLLNHSLALSWEVSRTKFISLSPIYRRYPTKNNH